VRRPLRTVLAIALPGAVLLAALCFPHVVLEQVVMPSATALWLVLRTFVLSVHQGAWWWGLIVLVAFASLVVLLRRFALEDAARAEARPTAWNPARRWRDSILANVHAEPSRDSFRSDAAWLLSSLYASPRPGSEIYQVRDALRRGEIPLPPAVHDFLFAEGEPPPPIPSFFADPRACVRETVASMRRAARQRSRSRRRTARYVRSAEEVLAFMETQLEMTHERDD
jgi:hypothetical protein